MGKDRHYKVNPGSAFHADSVTVMHSPTKFMLDFRLTTARLDKVEGEQKQTFVVEHDAVVMDPKLAKQLIKLLEENVAKYEEHHEEIEVPEPTEDPEAESEEETVESADTAYIG